jgi:hypothetical protein
MQILDLAVAAAVVHLVEIMIHKLHLVVKVHQDV